MTLAELEAAGEKAGAIKGALERLKEAEWKLELVNRYAKENAGKVWRPDLQLAKSDGYWSSRTPTITVEIPHDFILRQAINAVIAARRAVVQAGGELPPATEQVQRGRS